MKVDILPISIKNGETELRAREVAKRTGETLTATMRFRKNMTA